METGTISHVCALSQIALRKHSSTGWIFRSLKFVHRALCALSVSVAALLPISPATGQDVDAPIRDTFGEVGLIEMPSARMAPDGQISVTVTAMDEAQRFNFAFQLLPWLEGEFRYSRLVDFGTPGVADYDRGLGMKIRLTQESQYTPEISVGIRDMLSSGAYGAEYVVASKRYRDLDVTAGLGWGRLATQPAFANPFRLIFASFKDRKDATTPQDGAVNFGAFFHGHDVGMFGGIDWHTPIDGLDVLAEYSSDRYLAEGAGDGITVRTPFNIGLSYRPFDGLSMSAAWLYGTTYGVTATVYLDPTRQIPVQQDEAALPSASVRNTAEQREALASLLNPKRFAAAATSHAPWVSVHHSPGDPKQQLVQSLMAVGMGVRDIEFAGHMLIINASKRNSYLQCNTFAQLASASRPAVDTIALSDLNAADGNVTFCGVLHPKSFASEEIVADNNSIAADIDALPLSSTGPDSPKTEQAVRRTFSDLEKQSIRVDAISFHGSHAWVYFSNNTYYFETAAIGRVIRILMADAPASVELFHLVSMKHGLPLREVDIVRSALERSVTTDGSARELGQAIEIMLPPADNPLLGTMSESSYPRFHWWLNPSLGFGFVDSNTPGQIQLLLAAEGSVEISPALEINGRIEATAYNNLGHDPTIASVLPHVRSDYARYYDNVINGIARLDASYHVRLAPDLIGEVTAGYFESMFAGVGGELLWQPEGERLTIGSDLYEVWQRNFDGLFGLQNYHVLTGHISLYYESPWDGLNFTLHAGRYLAGDYGATIEVARRFSSGIEVSAYATFTNAPSSNAGGDGFDKGISLRIPLEWMLPGYTPSSFDARLGSLTRNAGQRLDGDDSLYVETRSTSLGELNSRLDDIQLP